MVTTDEITCPGCGEKRSNSWEANAEDEHDCDRCGLHYAHKTEVVSYYHTGPTCPKCPDRMLQRDTAGHWRCSKCGTTFILREQALADRQGSDDRFKLVPEKGRT